MHFLQSDLPAEEEEEEDCEPAADGSAAPSKDAGQSSAPIPAEVSIFNGTEQQPLQAELQGLNMNDPRAKDVKANATPALELPTKDPDSSEEPVVVEESPA